MKLIHFSKRDVFHIIFYIVFVNTSLISAIKIDPDGGYKDIVIRIASDGSVPENDCPKILYNIKVSDLHVNYITFLIIFNECTSQESES